MEEKNCEARVCYDAKPLTIEQELKQAKRDIGHLQCDNRKFQKKLDRARVENQGLVSALASLYNANKDINDYAEREEFLADVYRGILYDVRNKCYEIIRESNDAKHKNTKLVDFANKILELTDR